MILQVVPDLIELDFDGTGFYRALAMVDFNQGIPHAIRQTDFCVSQVAFRDFRFDGKPFVVGFHSNDLDFSDVTWDNIASSANAGRGVELHNDTEITNMEI